MSLGRMMTVLLAGALSLGGVAGAAAQDYPSRPLEFIVPFAPGGGTDLISRLLSEGLSRELGQPVVVLNRPGQANSVAGEILARSEPDGHTFMLASAPSVTNQFLYTDMSVDISTFTPVSLLTVQPHILTVHPSVEAETIEEFAALLQEDSDKINFGTYGWGSLPELNMLMLGEELGIEPYGIAYSGGGPAFLALMSGEIQALFSTVLPALPNIEAGMVRPMAFASRERNDTLPDVPTFFEAGLEVLNQSFFGIVVAPGTPDAIVEHLSAAVINVMSDPNVKTLIEESGSQVVATDAPAFAVFLDEQRARLGNIIESTGIVARRLETQ